MLSSTHSLLLAVLTALGMATASVLLIRRHARVQKLQRALLVQKTKLLNDLTLENELESLLLQTQQDLMASAQTLEFVMKGASLVSIEESAEVYLVHMTGGATSAIWRDADGHVVNALHRAADPIPFPLRKDMVDRDVLIQSLQDQSLDMIIRHAWDGELSHFLDSSLATGEGDYWYVYSKDNWSPTEV